MKTELDTLRERAAEVIHAADPASVILTPKQGEAICTFIVEALETQRRWTETATAGTAQVWGTVGQIAKRLGMDASGVHRLIAGIRSSGCKLRTLKPDAIPGHKTAARYHIGDVESAMMGLDSANDRKEARR